MSFDALLLIRPTSSLRKNLFGRAPAGVEADLTNSQFLFAPHVLKAVAGVEDEFYGFNR